jgi:hypothetical protein
MKTHIRWLLCPLLALTFVCDAYAVVGRPFTPVSYAGVARRSARRTVRRTSYRMSGAAALPAGCAVGIPCYGATYRPVYEGATVVYVTD